MTILGAPLSAVRLAGGTSQGQVLAQPAAELRPFARGMSLGKDPRQKGPVGFSVWAGR